MTIHRRGLLLCDWLLAGYFPACGCSWLAVGYQRLVDLPPGGWLTLWVVRWGVESSIWAPCTNTQRHRNTVLDVCLAEQCFCQMWVLSPVHSALMLLVGHQEGHLACKQTEWWGAGVVVCLERGADLHTAQLMPLPLTVSCFSEIHIGFTFLVLAYPGCPWQRVVKQMCVYLPVSTVENWRIFLKQSFTARSPLLTTLAFSDWG